jgi:hypothetical protein
MNSKAWDRFYKQLEVYKDDTMDGRKAFWNEFLTSGTQEEWKCTQCNCESFKRDNLRYLEEKANEKTK